MTALLVLASVLCVAAAMFSSAIHGCMFAVLAVWCVACAILGRMKP